MTPNTLTRRRSLMLSMTGITTALSGCSASLNNKPIVNLGSVEESDAITIQDFNSKDSIFKDSVDITITITTPQDNIKRSIIWIGGDGRLIDKKNIEIGVTKTTIGGPIFTEYIIGENKLILLNEETNTNINSSNNSSNTTTPPSRKMIEEISFTILEG